MKTLNASASNEDQIKFLQEAAIMAQFRHSNVVALCGVAKKDGKVCVNNHNHSTVIDILVLC